MKTILVPTDFSVYSLKALQYSIHIAQKSGAKIILMHAYDLMDTLKSQFHSLMLDHYTEAKNQLLQQLEAIKKQVKQTEKLDIEIYLTYGNVTNNILFIAEKYKVDLIVMGTLGSTGLKSTLFGSKATTVLRNSKIPVFILPHKFEWAEPKNILITVKQEQEKVELFQPVFEIAALFNGQVNVLTFTDDHEDAFEVIADTRTISLLRDRIHLVYPSLDVQFVQLHGHNFIDRLRAYIKTNKCNLLVMIHHHNNWIQHFTGTSATELMALTSEIPLLSLHPEEDDFDF